MTVGPVLDASGVAVTDSVVGDFLISKNGAAPAALNGSATLTHRHTGNYSLSLTATDLNTVGTAEVTCSDTVNACPIKEIQVVETVIYDSLFADAAAGYQVPIWSSAGATVSLSATTVATVTTTATATAVTTVNGLAANVITAASIADGAIDEATFATTAGSFAPLGIIDQGTAQSATGTTVVLRAAAAFADTTLVGATILVHGSTQGYWQSRSITANTLSGDTVTVDTWTVTPSGTITYKIYAGPPAPLTPAEVNMVQISGDPTAANNLEAAYDGGGYAHTGNTYPWTASWDAEVQSEVQDAIEANNLDHLLAVAAVAGDAVNSSIVARLASKSATPAFTSFNNLTDSLEAIRDNTGTAGVGLTSVTAAIGAAAPLIVSGSTIGFTGNDTTHINLTGTGMGDDELNDLLLIIRDNSAGEYHARWVEDFVASTNLITVATLPFTPEDSTDTVNIFAFRRDTMKLGPTQTANITGNITGNLVGTVSTLTTYTGNTPQTGDSFARIGATGSGLTSLASQASVDAVQADLPQRITKNTALAAFPFFMVLSADHVTGATGLTVTATRSLDGAAFGACANAVTEISNGWYKIDLAAGDLNGNTVALLFTAATADSRSITIATQPT